MIKLTIKQDDKLINYLTEREGLNYNKVQTFLRKRDIKVNNTRIKSDIPVCENDEVIIFGKTDDFFKIETIYDDENIVIVNKPKKLEVVSSTRDIDLIKLINPNFYAVHRIDYNTEGLVVIAKNKESYDELLKIFKNRLIQKKYLCVACGNLIKETLFKNYLISKSDGKVEVSSSSQKDAQEILLNAKPIETIENFCLLDVDLLTGKTHQIRAQLAFNGLQILGDEKYGNSKINKKYGYKNQVLASYFIKFKLNNEIKKLNYLNNKVFEIKDNNVVKIFNNLKS